MVSWPLFLMNPPFLQVLRSWWVKASSQVCLNEPTVRFGTHQLPVLWKVTELLTSSCTNRWRFIPVTYSINDPEIASPKGFSIFASHICSPPWAKCTSNHPFKPQKKPGDFICCLLLLWSQNAPASSSSGFGASQFYLLAQSWNLAACDRKRTPGISPKLKGIFFRQKWRLWHFKATNMRQLWRIKNSIQTILFFHWLFKKKRDHGWETDHKRNISGPRARLQEVVQGKSIWTPFTTMFLDCLWFGFDMFWPYYIYILISERDPQLRLRVAIIAVLRLSMCFLTFVNQPEEFRTTVACVFLDPYII